MIFREETISSEYVYHGRVFDVRKDEVTVICGTSTRDIVEHVGGSACAAITTDRKIVLVKQYRRPFDDVIMEVPAGKFNFDGEDPLEAMKRELREETGYTAKEWTFLTRMKPSVGYTTEELHIFMAKDLTPGETDFDDNEAIDQVLIDFDEAYDMVTRGEITDGKTIVAICLAKNLL
ncbi:MAG: NUDIX hydrolase [Firmicutes bacterium]|nr:NUDIX hydrolase [Bacillota bacterium]